MKQTTYHYAATAAALSLCSAALPAVAQTITVTASSPGSVYHSGEKIVWHLGVTGDGAADIHTIRYVIKKGALTEIDRGELTVKDGAVDLAAKLDEPGSVLAELTAVTPEGKAPIKEFAGAVVSPESIRRAAPRPADFDAFWKAKIAELEAVPANPVLEPGDSPNPTVEYSKITLDNIRATKIRGQIARPRGGGKHPALLIVQWAGVYPLQKAWVIGHARDGWLTLNINAHDLPIDETPEFYQQQNAGALRDYTSIGNDDREKSYFLRMFLSCYRAADYLASLPDWDGKTLVVMGTSQGGLQSFVTAGLHPKITVMIANVPAGSDQSGPLVGRLCGWPYEYNSVRGKDAARVRETSKYFDAVNFAPNIHCPALVAVGLIDVTSPVAGVLATSNETKGAKEILYMERSDHQGRNNTQAPFNRRAGEWLTILAKGDPAPVGK